LNIEHSVYVIGKLGFNRGINSRLRVAGYGLRGAGLSNVECGMGNVDTKSIGQSAWCVEQDDLKPEYLTSDFCLLSVFWYLVAGYEVLKLIEFVGLIELAELMRSAVNAQD